MDSWDRNRLSGKYSLIKDIKTVYDYWGEPEWVHTDAMSMYNPRLCRWERREA